MWCDSHCHVPYEGLGTEVIDEARLAGVTRLVTVGTDAAQSALALEIAASHEGVWATVGLHPHDASKGVETVEPLLRDNKKLVAVGECGLDYHYDLSPRAVQRDAFAAQVALAVYHDLALVVHTREAWNDTFDILASAGAPERTIFHCFTGGPDEARRALDIGAWLSFSGIVTFNRADDVRAAAELCPIDRLLVETDSPFLAPVPHRGKRNSPKWVPLVGAAIAELKGIALSSVEEATWQGAEQVFAFAGKGPRPLPAPSGPQAST